MAVAGGAVRGDAGEPQFLGYIYPQFLNVSHIFGVLGLDGFTIYPLKIIKVLAGDL